MSKLQTIDQLHAWNNLSIYFLKKKKTIYLSIHYYKRGFSSLTCVHASTQVDKSSVVEAMRVPSRAQWGLFTLWARTKVDLCSLQRWCRFRLLFTFWNGLSKELSLCLVSLIRQSTTSSLMRFCFNLKIGDFSIIMCEYSSPSSHQRFVSFISHTKSSCYG